MKKIVLAALLLLMWILPARAVSFEDAKGRTVTLDETPSRVAALLGSYAEIWLEAGGTLAGATEDAAREGIANLGGHTQPNMELLLALDPDFVILTADSATDPAVGETLTQAGIPHGYFSVENWQEYMRLMRIFTEITGREDLYRQKIETVQKPIQAMIQSAQARPEYQNQTALLLRAFATNVKAKGSEGTVAGPILRDMGLVNIADGDSALAESLSLESILMADPDYIFIVTMGADPAAAEKMLQETLMSNPAWNTLTAVRQGHCHMLDKALFHLRPNGRWAESYEMIEKWIYETE